jgi:hypothetical protein
MGSVRILKNLADQKVDLAAIKCVDPKTTILHFVIDIGKFDGSRLLRIPSSLHIDIL